MRRCFLVLFFLLCALNASPLLAQEPSATDRDHAAQTLLKAFDGSHEAADMALLTATETGNLEAVKALLKAGETPKLFDHHGRTPLYLAAMHGHTDIVSLLLKSGVEPDVNIDRAASLATLFGHADTAAVLQKSATKGKAP